MRPTHEVLTPEDAPTPIQLFQLAASGILLAKAHNKLRVDYRDDGHVKKAILPYVVLPPVETADLPRYTPSRQVALRIARMRFSDWSMRIIDRQHFTYDDVLTDGFRRSGSQVGTYGFEWSRRGTTLAWRRIRIAPGLETEACDLADDIDQFAVDDDLAAFWHARSQLEQVTRGDMPELMSELQRYADDAHLLVG